MTSVLLTAALIAAAPAKTVWINEDNQHFYDGRFHGDEDMSAEGCRRLVDAYADTGVCTGILFCVNMQMALYDSKVWERFKDQPTDYSYQRHLRLLSERGVDQFKEWLGRCRERGIAAWLSMRMNDCHALEFVAFNLPIAKENSQVLLWPSQWWRQHPELRRAPYRIEHGWEGAFNYLKDEVYAHHLRLVEEIFSKWDMDGLELDWMRWAMHFPPGGEFEGRARLTAFMKDVRRLADAASRRLGHRVELSCRVPSDPEMCLRFGYDVAAWSQAGCLDRVTLAGFGNETPNDVPIELWRRLLRPGTSIVCGLAYGGVSGALYNSVSGDDLLRGNAASAWACGADGVYLFNECYREPAHMDEFAAYMRSISSMDALNATNRRCAVTGTCAMPGYSARRTLPADLSLRFGGHALERLDPHLTLRLTTGPVKRDADCTLALAFDAGLKGVTPKNLSVRLNTIPLMFLRRIELDPHRVDQTKSWVTCTDYPRDAQTVYLYSVPASILHSRENAIEVIPPEKASGQLVWADLSIGGVAMSANAESFQLVEGDRAAADVVVEVKSPSYDLNQSVTDFLDQLQLLTGVRFALRKAPIPGRRVIRIVADPTLAEQESRVTIDPQEVVLASSDHPEYAIYDFLRDACGVEWLDPTEAGTIFPAEKLKKVRCRTWTTKPYSLARRNSGVFTTYNPLLWRDNTPGWTNFVQTAYPEAYAKGGFAQAVREMNFFRTRFKRRMKAQGRSSTANHSFYWFNDRFLNRKDSNFIAFHPEYFAKGYEKKEDANKNPQDIYSDWDPRKAPPQMCYSNEGFFRQTLIDVRAYFDIGGYTNRYSNQGCVCDAKHPAPIWGVDTYCLEPHDNEAFCRCPDCAKQYRPERAAEHGQNSDYWFGFVNRVAREIKKTHPGKKISTLAYGSGREAMPSFRLEDNVVVHFCYSCNRMPNCEGKALQERLLREWHAAYSNHTFGVWLYNCFPMERTVRPGGFNCFPGFFGRELADQYRFLKEMNVREIIFNCGMTDDFESFLTFRLMWNPEEDYESLKDKWFSSFGAAEKPIRSFYDLVESRFTNPKNYPPKSGHQTMLIAWGYLGTEAVYRELAKLMSEAESAADSPQAKARVANWKAGVWNYIEQGKHQVISCASGRAGVTAKLEKFIGMRPPAWQDNLLAGKPVSASCNGVWHAILRRRDGKAEKRDLKNLAEMTDGELTTDFWMNGHPTEPLTVCVKAPIGSLGRLRLVLNYTDFIRSCGIFVPVGFKDGKVIELAGEVRQSTRPNPNWRCDNDNCRCWQTIEWTFAPGTVPSDLDGVGFIDRGIREKWYTPPIAEIEAEQSQNKFHPAITEVK